MSKLLILKMAVAVQSETLQEHQHRTWLNAENPELHFTFRMRKPEEKTQRSV
jgi:hypothetical protein